MRFTIKGSQSKPSDLFTTRSQFGRDHLPMVGQRMQFRSQGGSPRIPRIVVHHPKRGASRERAPELDQALVRASPNQGNEQVVQRREVVLNQGGSHAGGGGHFAI